MVDPDIPSKDNGVAQYRMIGENSKMQGGRSGCHNPCPALKIYAYGSHALKPPGDG